MKKLPKNIGDVQTQNIPKAIVEAVANDPIPLKTIPYVHPRWWGRILQFFLLIPKTKVLSLYAPHGMTMIRIAEALSGIKNFPKGKLSDSELLEVVYKLIVSDMPKIIEVIAFGLHNSRGLPPKWLMDTLYYDFSQDELVEAFIQVHRRLGVETFFVISAYAKGLQANDMLGIEVLGQQSET